MLCSLKLCTRFSEVEQAAMSVHMCSFQVLSLPLVTKGWFTMHNLIENDLSFFLSTAPFGQSQVKVNFMKLAVCSDCY